MLIWGGFVYLVAAKGGDQGGYEWAEVTLQGHEDCSCFRG